MELCSVFGGDDGDTCLAFDGFPCISGYLASGTRHINIFRKCPRCFLLGDFRGGRLCQHIQHQLQGSHMVKWVCQIVTPVRHRALIFNARLFAGTAADDALVADGTFRFYRLVCLCVKRRNVILNGKCRSLPDSALFHADNCTEQKTFSPFSLALIFTFDFAALSERRSCPENRSRRFVPLVRWMRHFAGGHIPFGRSCNFQGSGAIARPF